MSAVDSSAYELKRLKEVFIRSHSAQGCPYDLGVKGLTEVYNTVEANSTAGLTARSHSLATLHNSTSGNSSEFYVR